MKGGLSAFPHGCCLVKCPQPRFKPGNLPCSRKIVLTTYAIEFDWHAFLFLLLFYRLFVLFPLFSFLTRMRRSFSFLFEPGKLWAKTVSLRSEKNLRETIAPYVAPFIFYFLFKMGKCEWEPFCLEPKKNTAKPAPLFFVFVRNWDIVSKIRFA